jgi:NADH oxidase (H2O2-forming)
MSKKLVIVGNGTAGASVALAARKADRAAEITVLDREPYPTYSKCALPFVIEGIIKDFEDITVFSRGFYKHQKVNLINNAEVTEIDPDAKKVVYKKEGAEHTIY